MLKRFKKILVAKSINRKNSKNILINSKLNMYYKNFTLHDITIYIVLYLINNILT